LRWLLWAAEDPCGDFGFDLIGILDVNGVGPCRAPRSSAAARDHHEAACEMRERCARCARCASAVRDAQALCEMRRVDRLDNSSLIIANEVIEIPLSSNSWNIRCLPERGL